MRVPTFVPSLVVTVLLVAGVVAMAIAPAQAATSVLSLALSSSVRAAAVSGVAPMIESVSDMTVNSGEIADQTVHATDADGDPLTFYKSSGPPYMSVTTIDAGSGSATGNIHLEPVSLVNSTSSAAVGVSDGGLTAAQAFSITVVGSDTAPVLLQPSDMIVRAGLTQDQVLTATDADGDALAFTKISGPSYVTVMTTEPGTGTAHGNVHIAPGPDDAGFAAATIAVGDETLSDEKSFQIQVLVNNVPTLDFVSDMATYAGNPAYQYIYANDLDGDPLTFSKNAGPSYLTLTTISSGTGSATGLITLNPTADDVGTTSAIIQVSDGVLATTQSFGIVVHEPDHPPALERPADMTTTVGERAKQTVNASDPDGDYIYLQKSSGPYWLSVPYTTGYGSVSATIAIAPGPFDTGVTSGTLVATSNGLSDTKSFQITVLAGSFPPSCGSNSFERVYSTLGSSGIEVQSGDLDGDGIADLLVEMPSAAKAGIALGNGDGTFGALSLLAAGTYPISGAIDDFNGDEYLDVAILDLGTEKIYVFLGDGVGGFGDARAIPVGYARSLLTADVNGDGIRDLLVADPQAGEVRILRGGGDGTFLPPVSYLVGLGAWTIATADLNGDGAPEVIVSNVYVSTISVLRNDGTGAMGSRVDYPVDAQPYGLAARDVDENGTVDVAVTNSGSASVTIYYGAGDGTLGAPRSFMTGSGSRQVAIEDWNGDGHVDLAISNLNAKSVSVLLGTGAGAFGARTDFSMSSSGPSGIATGDFDDDLRPDFVVAGYSEGTVSAFLNGCAPDLDHPPVVVAPRKISGSEGSAISFAISASDPDGPPVTSLVMDVSALPLGHDATLITDPTGTQGTFSWTPSYQSARAEPYPVTFTASNVISGSSTTKITVLHTNRAPVADAGGPYVGLAGGPISFDGHASADPDGDPLTYAWVFGDGKSGLGAEVSHTYAAVGIYGVALTVSDGMATGLAVTTATVQGIFEARAFTDSGNRSIRLSSGKPTWCAELEPVGRSYSNVTVDLGSIVMRSDGTGTVGEIHAIAGKGARTGDSDGNGVAEITACFTKDDLRLLFASLHGKSTVTVTFEGALYTGGIFRARMDVSVNAGGGALAATISPNPLNPEAVLTFRTERAGPVRVSVYDVHGRLVSQPLDGTSVPAGYHDVRISGRREDGAPLASGVYFYRIQAAEGEQTGRFTVLK